MRTYDFSPRAEPAPWRQWGDDLDPKSIEQMTNACQLPISVCAALMPDAKDPTPNIVKAALDMDEPCELCRLTAQTFISILGSEAGNLALKVFATGGVYVGGGIPPRILPLLEQERSAFLHAFCNRGIMTEVMERIPVQVITQPQVTLMGAYWMMAP